MKMRTKDYPESSEGMDECLSTDLTTKRSRFRKNIMEKLWQKNEIMVRWEL